MYCVLNYIDRCLVDGEFPAMAVGTTGGKVLIH
jgi:hypothetical protein